MGLLDLALGAASPVACYMYPELDGNSGANTEQRPADSDLFIFQYWPQSLSINYEPNYAEHEIPGASHPLFQWVGGRGRAISFEAVFTSEVDLSAPINVAPSLTRSGRYSVNVAAALSRIQSYMMPTYQANNLNQVIVPPKRLILVFPGTGLGGGGRSSATSGGALNTISTALNRNVPTATTYDAVRVVLISAPMTIESWFPNGTPRIATVQFQFKESIQQNGSGATSITYAGSRPFNGLGGQYKYDGKIENTATTGSA